MPPKKRKPVPSIDPVSDMHQRLQMLGYITSDRALMAECYALQMKAMVTTKAVPAILLQGPPGTGKTFLAETMQRDWQATNFLFYQFAPGVTREDLVFDLNIANIAMAQAGKWKGDFRPEDTISPGKLTQALLSSQKERTVLLLDELDKASEKVDAFLLDYLQSCRLDAGQLGVIRGNPRNLLVFITMNNQRQISEPLMRRCLRHELAWPVPAVEEQMIVSLALRQLQQFPRAPYPDLQIQVKALAPLLVQFANEIRGYAQQLKKVPSSPELADALVDLALLPNSSDWGEKVYATLLAYPDDRKMAKGVWQKSPADLGRQLLNAVTTARRKRDEARKSRQQGGSPLPETPVVQEVSTPAIEHGKYYYEAAGIEPAERLADMVQQGVLVRKMSMKQALEVEHALDRAGVNTNPVFHRTSDGLGDYCWDAYIDIPERSYSDIANSATLLPSEWLVRLAAS